MHILSKQFFQTVSTSNKGWKIQKVNISEIINSKYLIVLVANTPKYKNVEIANVKIANFTSDFICNYA